MLLELLIVFLLHGNSEADIIPLDRTYIVKKVNEDVFIPWTYDYENDMFNVGWSFKNSSSTTVILTKVLQNPAQVHNNFNVQHDGNGNITLKKVTTENEGIYYCKVVYTGASARITVTGTATLSIDTGCTCTSDGHRILIASIIAVVLVALMFIVVLVVLIIVLIWTCCDRAEQAIIHLKKTVCAPVTGFVIVIALGFVIGLLALIVGIIALVTNDECRNCTSCDISKCDTNDHLGIANIVIGSVLLAINIALFVLRLGWCGERLTCLNTVLPVCTDTEARGCPDGKSDNPAAKEKHREVKLLTQKEQTQQHHKETVVNKGKPSGEKQEEPSKGQPRPLPVPTGNNRDDTGSAGAVSRQDVVLGRRPMPEIPSDKHKRGLSANYSDDRDKPLDDNILHTLPVVKKPKNALDPMNDDGKSKNSDDQPKKKKKKKKDRDTSRSEEMEDDIDSHEKVLAF